MKKTYLLISCLLLAQFALGQGKFFGGIGQGYSCEQVRDTLACVATSGTANLVGCDSVEANGQTYTSSGTYLQTLTNVDGCDSSLTLLVTIHTVDVSLTVASTSITANGSGSYQWLDCDNAFAIISGANAQTFTPLVTGNYAVAVTSNGCTDTSACTSITVTGLSEERAQRWTVSPNPTEGQVVLRSEMMLGDASIRLVDGMGRTLQVWKMQDGNALRLHLEVSAGVYFLQVHEADGHSSARKLLVR